MYMLGKLGVRTSMAAIYSIMPYVGMNKGCSIILNARDKMLNICGITPYIW